MKLTLIGDTQSMLKKFSVRSLMLAAVMLAIPAASSAGIVFSIGIAPPPLPVYEQPLCPGDGYIWTPGYWSYNDDGGYFWVPGTWAMAPEPGFLWTPGYWGWGGSLFAFHEGYWGPRIGFYGGINYGFGYFGVGYEGGYWRNGAFFYNRSVNNVRNVTNIYNKTVINNTTVRNVSYNGGEGGIERRPTSEEEAAASERHVPPTSNQIQHVQTAASDHRLYESQNHGRPAIAATEKPGDFKRGAVEARSAGESYRPAEARTHGAAGRPAEGAAARPEPGGNPPVHVKDLPAMERPAPNTGDPKLDKKYQQQQAKIQAKQDQERQKLEQQQEQEHQRLDKQKASDAQKQQIEQKHQRQTQQLAQKHSQEQQRFQQRMPSAKQKR
jgi:hypothetical protein